MFVLQSQKKENTANMILELRDAVLFIAWNCVAASTLTKISAYFGLMLTNIVNI